ncbi:MAG TPA: hypothetical protein PK876_01665 [Elusimicrobiota bacterium]|nr:hypothetical protein [Elusimicrobiota bacterium]
MHDQRTFFMAQWLETMNHSIKSSKVYSGGVLHWMCIVFLCGYVVLMQWGYAVSDPSFAVDHDYPYLHLAHIFDNEEYGPWSHIKEGVQGMVLHRGENWRGQTIQSLTLSLFFLVFGQTLVAYKMSLVWWLLGLALAAYVFLFRQTKSELTALSGTLLLVTLPSVITNSRKYFGFLPVACLLLWAFHVFLLYEENRRTSYFAMVCALFYLGSLAHHSIYLYAGIFGAYWLIQDRRAALSFLSIVIGIILWNSPKYALWFSMLFGAETVGGAPSADIGILLRVKAYVGYIFEDTSWNALKGIIMNFRGHLGSNVFYALILGILVYAGSLRRGRKWSDCATRKAMMLLAAFLAGSFLIMNVFVCVESINFLSVYVAGILLTVLVLWELSRYENSWVSGSAWICLVGLALYHAASPYHGHPPAYNERDYPRDVYDPGLLVDYMKGFRNMDGMTVIKTLRTGLRAAPDGQLKYVGNFYYIHPFRNYLDSPAFFHDVIFQTQYFDPLETHLPGFVGKWIPPDKAADTASEYHYLIVLVDWRDRQDMATEATQERVAHVIRDNIGSVAYRKIFSPFRYMTGFKATEGLYFYVYGKRPAGSREAGPAGARDEGV